MTTYFRSYKPIDTLQKTLTYPLSLHVDGYLQTKNLFDKLLVMAKNSLKARDELFQQRAALTLTPKSYNLLKLERDILKSVQTLNSMFAGQQSTIIYSAEAKQEGEKLADLLNVKENKIDILSFEPAKIIDPLEKKLPEALTLLIHPDGQKITSSSTNFERLMEISSDTELLKKELKNLQTLEEIANDQHQTKGIVYYQESNKRLAKVIQYLEISKEKERDFQEEFNSLKYEKERLIIDLRSNLQNDSFIYIDFLFSVLEINNYKIDVYLYSSMLNYFLDNFGIKVRCGTLRPMEYDPRTGDFNEFGTGLRFELTGQDPTKLSPPSNS